MNADMISRGIRAPQATSRIKAVWMADMLEETGALPALMTQYRIETVDEVKRAIAQAGRRLKQAVNRNYTTLDAICEHYLIDRMIFEMPSKRDTHLMHRVQTENQTLSANMGRGLLGPTVGGRASVGVDPSTPQHELTAVDRTMPIQPRDEDIRPYIKTLRTSRDSRQRVEAILRMGGVRNPKALPDIAIAYKKDDATEVRDTAERIGKRVYWNAVYLAMENSGMMAEEIERRAREAGKLDEPAPVSSDSASPEEIAALLDRAQRQKKQR